jgi:hypothetical protein
MLRSTSTDAFQTCDAGRARVHLPSEAGRPDMTIGCAEADRAGARPSYGGCQAWIGVFGDYLIGFMPWVTGHQTDIETEFNRVIDMVISSPQSFDVSSEDRALQGCNSSAETTLHTAGEPALNRACRLAVPAGASQKR